MRLETSEKIKIMAKRSGLTLGELAEKTGQSRQNFSNKLKRSNFPEKELEEIAAVLGYELEITFKSKETGDTL